MLVSFNIVQFRIYISIHCFPWKVIGFFLWGGVSQEQNFLRFKLELSGVGGRGRGEAFCSIFVSQNVSALPLAPCGFKSAFILWEYMWYCTIQVFIRHGCLCGQVEKGLALQLSSRAHACECIEDCNIWNTYIYIHTYTLFMLEIYRVAVELISSRK